MYNTFLCIIYLLVYVVLRFKSMLHARYTDTLFLIPHVQCYVFKTRGLERWLSQEEHLQLFRVIQLGLQHPCDDSQLSVTPICGDLTPSSGR